MELNNLKEKVNNLVDTLKAKFAKEEVHKFAETKLKDGTIIQYEGELAAGTAVSMVQPGGQTMVCPNGNYETEDGKMFTCTDGVVTDITSAMPEVVVQAKKMFEEEIAKRDAVIEAQSKELNEVKASFAQTVDLLKDMFAVVEQLAEKPAEEPKKPEKTSLAKTVVSGRESAFERMQKVAQKFNK